MNRLLHACCSTGQTRARRWSLHAQKCDPTCPSPATGPSSTHSEPVNTSRQIRKIHTVNHVPIAPLARVLSGSTFKSGLRALPLPHTRRAPPRAQHRCRRLALEEMAGASSFFKPERLAIDQRRLRRHFGRLRRPRMRRLPCRRSSPGLLNCQSKAANCRAQHGKWCEQGAKMGVVCHGLAHPVEVLASHLGK